MQSPKRHNQNDTKQKNNKLPDRFHKSTDLELGVLSEHPENGQLGSHRLPRAGGRPQQHVAVVVVEGVEDLRLHGVEVRELVQRLQAHVVQRRHRQRLEIQQLWKEKQNKMVEPNKCFFSQRHGISQWVTNPTGQREATAG